MDPFRFNQIRELFQRLRPMQAEQRLRELDAIAAEDPGLAREVKSLIGADANPIDLEGISIPRLDMGSGPTASLRAPQDQPQPHVSISGYDILRELKRGGQGVVYQALQQSTKRKVAVKVLLEGQFASESAQKRFTREIELVAQLRHPHIISVLESGRTQEGNQFFAMDYVRGLPFDQYVRENKPHLEEALRLFHTVCSAVQFAHQRAIIHRDLKPSNILVDTSGEPRLLDFGLAKWIGAPTNTVVSMSMDIMGTVPYMSPELTRGNPDEIDTRADVYALGVILYEMLTGGYPYPVRGELAEVLQHITSTPPVLPLRRWTPEQGISPRSTRVRSSKCPIDNELQTIVLRALAKEPERRYQSAGELARDLTHYLKGEPIEAKRDSRMYVVRKTLGSYKRGVAITALCVSLLSISVILFNSYTRTQRLNLANTLMMEAATLIRNRVDLQQADVKLRRSLEKHAGLAQAHLYRGLLFAIQGLSMPTDEKDAKLDRAEAELIAAHQLKGGTWPTPLTVVHPEDTQTGSIDAMRLAVELYFLLGKHDMAQLCADIANGISDTPNAQIMPIYDRAYDELWVKRFNEDTPSSVNVVADEEAEIHRQLGAYVGSLNPMYATSLNVYVTELLFDPLFHLNADDVVVPNYELLESSTQDHKTTTVRLKDDLFWNDDNTPLTTTDIKFSWDTIPPGPFAESKENIEAVEVVDAHTVVFHHKVASNLWDLRVPLIPKHVFDAYASEENNEDRHRRYGMAEDNVLVSNGPYKLTIADTNEIRLERWKNYPGTPPFIKTVIFHVAGDDDDELVEYLQGGRDPLDHTRLTAEQFLWHVNGASFDRIVKSVVDRRALTYISWNNDNPLFDSVEVRRALTQAMDLDTAIAHWHAGLYGKSVGPFEQVEQPLTRNVATAERLFEEAGWVRSEDQGIRRRDGKPFTFTLLVPAESEHAYRVMQDLQHNLAEIGVDMILERRSWLEVMDIVKTDDYEAALLSVVNSSYRDDAHRKWTKGAEFNYAHYHNPKVDQMFIAARTTTGQQQVDLYREINETIYHDQPCTFVWKTPDLVAVNKDLRGINYNRSRGIVGFHPGPRAWWFPKKRE